MNSLFIALATMLVGLVFAFRWEGIGGTLIMVGLACFAVVNHGVQINLVFGPMFVVGLMNLGCGWRRGKMG